MAPNSKIIPTKSSLLFLILLTLLVMHSAAPVRHLKETKLSVYYHEFLTGQNITFAMVAGIPGNRWSFYDFGTFFVTDDVVREGLSPDSPIIARSQGVYSVSSLDGSNVHSLSSLVFTNKAYKGSTLEFQGRFAQTVNITEISVVSGTGKFRFARGYAIMETFILNATYTVTRTDITLRFD